MPKKHIFRMLLTLLGITTTIGQDTNKQAAEQHILFLFSHGWKDNHCQMRFYQPDHTRNSRPSIITTPCSTVDYPDAINRSKPLLPQLYRLQRTSLGQTHEIKTLSTGYRRCRQLMPNADIVLFGVSRGASVAVTFAGAERPDNLRALILESPFDSVESLLHHQIGRRIAGGKTGKVVCNISNALAALLLRYRQDGPSPITMAKEIDKELPILIIGTNTDTSVPIECTHALYRRLVETGHTKVHLLILPSGQHARIARESSEGQLFQQVVHAFYRTYDLPHDPTWAAAGHEEFLRTKHE